MASAAESTNVTMSRPIASPTAKITQVKLVLLGESAVGKSSIVLRFAQGNFMENREPTIGAAFLTQKWPIDDRFIKFEIWDTAGQERFHSLAPMYYRNAQAAVVVYDITKASTLDKAKSWVKELQRQASPGIIIALVGNKLDLAKEASENEDNDNDVERQVPAEDAQAYAEESGLLFFETSAKTGENIETVFNEIAKKIPLDHKVANRMDGRGARNINGSVDLMQASSQSSSSSQCAC